eukprot:2098490-Pleurochrysis_carterae.AAC.3
MPGGVMDYDKSETETVGHKEWRDNMSFRGEPEITDLAPGTASYTQITLTPDFSRFGDGKPLSATPNGRAWPEDMTALLHRRAYEVAACAAPAQVSINGTTLAVNDLQSLMELYLPRQPSKDVPQKSGKTRKKAAEILLAEKEKETSNRLVVGSVGDRWEIGVCLSPTQGFTHASFVNGVSTSLGGTHVELVSKTLVAAMLPKIAKVGTQLDPRVTDCGHGPSLQVLCASHFSS